MYYLPRRRGARGVAGARARQQSADYHKGSYRTYLRRPELEAVMAARGDRATKKPFVAKLFQRTADPRNLRLAWKWIAQNDGQAPGADGLRLDDLDVTEVWPVLRTVGKSILRKPTGRSQTVRRKSPRHQARATER